MVTFIDKKTEKRTVYAFEDPNYEMIRTLHSVFDHLLTYKQNLNFQLQYQIKTKKARALILPVLAVKKHSDCILVLFLSHPENDMNEIESYKESLFITDKLYLEHTGNTPSSSGCG